MEELKKLTVEERQRSEQMINENMNEMKLISGRLSDIIEEEKNFEYSEKLILIKEIVDDIKKHLKIRNLELQSQIIFFKAALNIK